MHRSFVPAVVALAVVSSLPAAASAGPVAIKYTCQIGDKGGIVLASPRTDAVVTVDLRSASNLKVGDHVSLAGTMSVALDEKVRRPLRLTTSSLRLRAEQVAATVTSGKQVREAPARWESKEIATTTAPLTLTGTLELPSGVAAQAGRLDVTMPEALELKATGTGVLGPTAFSLTCSAADDARLVVASGAVAAKPVAAPSALGLPAAPSPGPSEAVPPASSAPVAQDIPRAAPVILLPVSDSSSSMTSRTEITSAAAVLVTLALLYAAWCELRLRGLRSRVR